MKIVLGATLLFIAIIQIATWLNEVPALGYPLAIVLIGIWVYEIANDMNARRR